MIKLSPSILAADFSNLQKDIRAVDEAGADMIHLDIMDGMFVPNISFGIPVVKSIRQTTKKIFDTHLMINEPIRYIKQFADAGSDIITVHYEACSDLKNTLIKIRENNCRVGLAISPDTPVEVVKPYLKTVDMILVMTVYPGFGGQKYIDKCTEKCLNLRRVINGFGLDTDIQVDGGIDAFNVHIPLKAGASVIVAGSAVFGGNIDKNVKEFKDAFQNFNA